ncbi:MAG: LamG domain-containing protein, partial [Candidatus Poribacteria bacterium]|nr:LamG domain-containing protein [Candidatus Poribacteria bacterium]
VLVWVNPSDDGIETWALRVADATNQDDLIIGLAQSLAPVIHMRVDNINRWSLIGKNLIDTGRWTHLAWVIDTRTDSARLYVDGRFDGQVDTDGVLPRDWGSLEESRGGVGISLENLNGEHNGVLGAVAQMDELNIWKRALTEAEIRSVMDRSAFSLAVEPQGKQTTTWAMLKSR